MIQISFIIDQIIIILQKNNIPVIFYFGGLHEDYHKPTDEVDKIDFSKLERTTKYIFLTAWELAYRNKRIK